MYKELSNETSYKKIKNSELFLLDMDGTLYLGDDVFDGAIDFINTLSENGKDYIYLTNNSSRAGTDYVTRLKKMGFVCEERNVYTSGMATAKYLLDKYKDKKILVLGTDTFVNELKSAGLKVFTSSEYDRDDFAKKDIFSGLLFNSAEEVRDHLDDEKELPVVCVGFDTQLVYRDLDLAVHFLRKGSVFIAANPDWVCPMPKGEVLPDCGSICALLTASSGVEPFYIGKPNRNMVDIISKVRGVPNERICCVGDRLYTDIAVAQNAGAVSICVLSGESSYDMVLDMNPKPDYTFDDVRDIAKVIDK